MEFGKTLSNQPNLAEFSVTRGQRAALTSQGPPLICPSTLRPEAISGRVLTHPIPADDGGFDWLAHRHD
jgi:hypothetical protein